MNVLITSVGRRAYMIKFFKEILAGGEVHVCNSDDKTVAFRYADKAVVSPLIYDENYIPFILDYCRNNNIGMVISLFDIDLLMLARAKKEFEAIGTTLVVSDEAVIEICNDKWKTYEFLRDNGFKTPCTYIDEKEVVECIDRGNISFPIVVKPRFGCGSIGIEIAENMEELRFYASKLKRLIEKTYLKYESAACKDIVIFQECIDGQEYGADVMNDLDGNYRALCIRKKLAMRAGETDIAEIVDNAAISETCKRLSTALGHIGNLDTDLFVKGDDVYVLELNARFGGGYPFSHAAGVNMLKALVMWKNKETVPDSLLQAKVGIRGYKELLVTNEF